MAKDAYWFRHDSNARLDPKILMMMAVYGYEGYGLFWAIIEFLRDQDEYKYKVPEKYGFMLMAGAISYDKDKLKEFIDDCVFEFDLLVFDGDNLYSNALIDRMGKWETKKKNGAKGGRPKVKKKPNQNLNKTETKPNEKLNDNRNETNIDKSIGDNIIEEERDKPAHDFEFPSPDPQMIKEFFIQKWPNRNGNFIQTAKEAAKSFYLKYDGLDWMSGGTRITKWENFAIRFIETWNKNEKQKEEKHKPTAGKRPKAPDYSNFKP